jgi:DNA helicase II / ATP-dependent DNA helicase PcrA
MNVLEGLNPAQRKAVETVEGPLLILAGPGSGKTMVITHRIAYLIKVCGASPHSILAVTFTNKAAREMKERLYHLLGSTVEQLSLGTFHAVCAAVLRREGQAIGVNPSYVIYDDGDQINLIKRSLQELGIDPKTYSPRILQTAISAAKVQLLTPEDYGQRTRSYFEEVVRRVYQQYQMLLVQSRALDFDDLLMRTYQLFQGHPKVLTRYQSRYAHVLIDEFQDTNLTQYALARQLAGKYRNICVVGDPDQSIYSWRQADIRNILNFEKDYPEAQTVCLEQSYRSTQTILEAAHDVVSVNRKRKESKLWTDNEAGLPVMVVEVYSESEEAQFVVREIGDLVDRGDVRPIDCAVMYRTNAQSRVLEEIFIRYGIPYQVVGAVRFYERREIKDLIAYLRLIYNHHDDISLMRIINLPPRGIGQRTLTEFLQWTKTLGIPLYTGLERMTEDRSLCPLNDRAVQMLSNFFNLIRDLIERSEELDVRDLLDSVIKLSRYREYTMEFTDGEERWGNILELRGIAQDHQNLKPRESLASFLEGVSLFSETDELDEKKDIVTLITLHQAKGLEFSAVFIVGMEEGILPHFKCFDDPAQMEEERRLCYVGMTRAKKRLYLVRTLRRSLMGGTSANPPSRFLRDIPRHLVKHVDVFEGVEVAPPVDARSLMIEVGDRVQHPKFGQGVVVSCNSMRDDCQVEVSFQDVGMKRLLLSLAPLERVEE